MSPLCFKHAMHIGAISSVWHLFPISPWWIHMLMQLADGPVFCSYNKTVSDVNNSSVIYRTSSKVSFAFPVKLWKLECHLCALNRRYNESKSALTSHCKNVCLCHKSAVGLTVTLTYDLQNLFSNAHMVNICGKFHWSPSTKRNRVTWNRY